MTPTFFDPDRIDHLAEAEQHLREGQWRLERQREVVARLERNSHSLGQAKILLKEFERIQATGVEHLARLRKEDQSRTTLETIALGDRLEEQQRSP